MAIYQVLGPIKPHVSVSARTAWQGSDMTHYIHSRDVGRVTDRMIVCGDQGKPFIQRMYKEEGKDPFFEQLAKL